MYSLYFSTWFFPEDGSCYEVVDHSEDYDNIEDALVALIYWIKLHPGAYPDPCPNGIIEIVTPIENGRQPCVCIMEDE